MAKLYFPKNEYTPIPEGTHIFRIYDVDYDVTFGKVVVKLVTAQGKTHTERYNIMRDDGSVNETACNALAYLSRAAINDDDLTEIEHEKLIGRYIQATVSHTVQPNRNDPSKTVTFVNLSEKKYAEGFDTEPVKKALTLGTDAEKPATQPSDVDLNSLLD